MVIQPYLFFDGSCEAALQFYQRAIGAEVELLMRYKDAPDPPPPGMVAPGTENKVMHVTFRVGESLVMASDGRCGGKADFQGFALSLALPGPADVDRAYAALVEGGKVDMPLGKTFWSPRFGMLTDRFGVRWMITVAT
jgi:PhnB protein